MVMRPSMMIPPATPQDRAEVYNLFESAKTSLGIIGETYAMTVPRSCRKKTSAIERGARHSAAPAASPMTILAAKNDPYPLVKASQKAVARYKAKLMI